MAVRITLSGEEDELPPETIEDHTRPTVRQSVGRALRRRFGFSLIHAPLLRSGTRWIEELDVPQMRREVVREPVRARSTRPLEERLEVSLLLRGRPLAPRA